MELAFNYDIFIDEIFADSEKTTDYCGKIFMELLDLHKSKQGNTTNLSISFSMENEKRAAQVGLKPMTWKAEKTVVRLAHVLMGCARESLF